MQARLFGWFLGAVALAVAVSAAAVALTSTDASEAPARLVSRHLAARVARLWDDPVATEAYLAEIRESTGLDVQVRRDVAGLVAARRPKQAGVVFEEGLAVVPVVRHGAVVGAIELRAAGRPSPWRLVLAALAALAALGLVARRVAARLARPLEEVAEAAERFGAGDLAARAVRAERDGGAPQATGEVQELARAFDQMAERIGRVVTDQRELLAAISHELRSPLGRARVALEIARERSPDPRARTSLDDVDRQLTQLDGILGDLLASARAGLGDLRTEKVDLVAWLRAAAAEAEGEVDLVIPSASAVPVAIDPALLRRALHNVLANARAHGHPAGQPVRVELTSSSDEVRLDVRDRGPGFAPHVLPRAFEPFVTGGGSARSPGVAHGLGLGLALVRRIVEAHGGRVAADNHGAGAVVTLVLPRAKEALERAAPAR